MKVLVTGASGLLGRAVVEEFQQAGHEGKLRISREKKVAREL